MENFKEQFKELYASIASTTFKDGPYEYGIKLVVGNIIHDELIIGMNIHVHNFPDYIGSDLLVYALGHLVDTKSEVLKNPNLKWALAKVKMSALSNIKDLSHSIFPEEVSDFLTLDEFSKVILGHKDKKIDLNKIKETIQTRTAKLTKALDYLKDSYQVSEEEIKKYEPFAITYDLSNNIKMHNSMMVPGINVTINFFHSAPFYNLDYRTQNTIKKDILDTLSDISPIDFYPYDNVVVKFASYKTLK